MTGYILVSLIAIFVWQIITLVVSIKDENAALIVGALIPYCIAAIIYAIIDKIYLLWCRNNLECYHFCCNNKGKITKSTCFYATQKFIRGLNQDNTTSNFIEKYKSCKDIQSAPSKSDIYKGEDVFRGTKIDLFKIKKD